MSDDWQEVKSDAIVCAHLLLQLPPNGSEDLSLAVVFRVNAVAREFNEDLDLASATIRMEEVVQTLVRQPTPPPSVALVTVWSGLVSGIACDVVHTTSVEVNLSIVASRPPRVLRATLCRQRLAFAPNTPRQNVRRQDSGLPFGRHRLPHARQC